MTVKRQLKKTTNIYIFMYQPTTYIYTADTHQYIHENKENLRKYIGSPHREKALILYVAYQIF